MAESATTVAWTRMGGVPLASGRVGRGWFVERPHRFAARVQLDSGETVEAHLANPGRLTGVLSPGCELALDGPFPPPRALPYTVLAARVRRVWAGTVTTYANRVFPALLEAGLFPEIRGEGRGTSVGARNKGQGAREEPSAGSLEPGAESRARPVVRAEVSHGRSRFDFAVADRLIEVKSVSLAEDSAGLFPDAVTARGARHARELADLARAGHPTAIVFVAQRADIVSVAPAERIDPDFAAALREAHEAGVLVLACALRLTPRGLTAARRIPVMVG